MKRKILYLLTFALALFFNASPASSQEVVYDMKNDLNQLEAQKSNVAYQIRSLSTLYDQFTLICDQFTKQDTQSKFEEFNKTMFLQIFFIESTLTSLMNTINYCLDFATFFIEYDWDESYYEKTGWFDATMMYMDDLLTIIRDLENIVYQVTYVIKTGYKAFTFQEMSSMFKRWDEEAKTKKKEIDDMSREAAQGALPGTHQEEATTGLAESGSSTPESGMTSLKGQLYVSLPLIILQNFKVNRSNATKVNEYKQAITDQRESVENDYNKASSFQSEYKTAVFALAYTLLGTVMIVLLISCLIAYYKGEQRHWDIWLKWIAGLFVSIIMLSILDRLI